MKTLYLIRHAKSSWEFDVLDQKRPLNQRGLKDANLIGEALKSSISNIDRVLCSPAERAYTTAKIITSHLGVSDDKFQIDDNLYDFDGRMVLEVIKSCDNTIASLMIFGHNHAFTDISNILGDKSIDNLPTAGVVQIQFDVDSWRDITKGKTISTLYPKSLK